MLSSKCMMYRPEVESRTQGSRPRPRTQKNPRPRPRPSFPRTDTLEAKYRNARGQGPRTQAQVLSKKKEVFTKIFQAILKKKVFTKIFQATSTTKRFPKNFSSAPQNFNNSRNSAVFEPRTGQFRGIKASTPRPRTSKCVLEAKDVLEDSTSGIDNVLNSKPCFPRRYIF